MTTVKQKTITMSPRLRKLLYGFGIVGIALWACTTKFHNNAPPLNLSRAQAVAAARTAFAQQGITLEKPWQPVNQVVADVIDQHQFIWRQQKKGDNKNARKNRN